jgi:hypothetical protein
MDQQMRQDSTAISNLLNKLDYHRLLDKHHPTGLHYSNGTLIRLCQHLHLSLLDDPRNRLIDLAHSTRNNLFR